jgi:hypothetical protein
MNLGELESALNLAVNDKSLVGYFTGWINNAILELAADLELPALKTVTPTALPVTTDTWLFALPTDFQKKLFRCTDENYTRVRRYRTLEALDRLDIDHDEMGDNVIAVAVSEIQIGVYPLANDTLHLWYYRKPTVLTRASDAPTCIPSAYHDRVIIPKATLKAYEHLQDQVENFDPKGLQYWQGKLAAGLRGSPVGGIGLVNYLSKIQGGSRRMGGRDPVGARYYA